MKKTIKMIAILLLCCSVTLALYPTLSKFFIQASYNKEASDFDKIADNIQDGSYEEAVEKGIIDDKGYLKNSSIKLPVLFKEDLQRLYDDSVAYNNSLIHHQQIYKSSEFEYSALNLSNYGIKNGMYGYISIPDIDLCLPIYLGSTNYNMSIGAVHLMNTSLPIGGEGTNSVLAGHTGFLGKTFFDNINKLDIGSKIKITNYFETLTYKVVSMQNIKSTDTNGIYIQHDKDIVNLITCSNGGITRLMVTCERLTIKSQEQK